MGTDRPRRPGDPGKLPALDELAAQLGRTVQVLARLVRALEEMAARPPVHLQVERLEVQTLAFHLGDIDVEQLEGQLNIGITHSLTLGPGPSPGAPEAPRPPEVDPARPLEIDPARPSETGGGQDPPEGARPGAGPAARGLRNSVVSRWRARAEQGGGTQEPKPPPPPRIQIWPPPDREGSERHEDEQPGAAG